MLKINMPSPCETSVTEMFQVLDGKFCKGCKRIVVDFRKMSDKQLLDYFSEHHGKICGEFRPQQLDREITMNIPSGMDRLRQKTAAVATIASLAMVVPVAQMQAQVNHEITEQPLRGKINPEALLNENQNNSDPETTIAGTVVDENGNTIIYANVMIQGITEGLIKGTTTDLDGNFHLSVSISRLEKEGLSLLVAYTGYTNTRIELNTKTASKPLKIVLSGEIIMGMTVGAIVIGEPVNSISTDTIKKSFEAAGGLSISIYERDSRTIGDTIVKAEIPKERIDRMSIFPNPFSQSFHVKIELAKKDQYELFIFDETGKVYWTESKKLYKGLNEFDIKMPEHLSAGSYIFHLRSKEMQLSEILVKAE